MRVDNYFILCRHARSPSARYSIATPDAFSSVMEARNWVWKEGLAEQAYVICGKTTTVTVELTRSLNPAKWSG